MKYIFLAVASLISISAFSQDSSKHKAKMAIPPMPIDTPAYKKNPHYPEFSLLLTDSSTHFTNLNIHKDKPTVIIYFSPDCSHCQADAKNMQEKLDSLKDINFIWSSSHDVDKIKDFAIKYQMNNLPNMIFGKDEKYAIPSFYKIQFTPYFAVYSKEGIFQTDFRNGVLPHELLKAVAEIKEVKEVIELTPAKSPTIKKKRKA